MSLDDKYLYFSNWIRGWALLTPLLSSAVHGSRPGRKEIAAALVCGQACSVLLGPSPTYLCRLADPRHVLRLRSDINQYDVSDPENPKHVGRVWVGGSIRKGSGVTVTEGGFLCSKTDVYCLQIVGWKDGSNI